MSIEVRRHDNRSRGQPSAVSLRPEAAGRAQTQEFDARLLQSIRQARQKMPAGNVRTGAAERARLSNASLFDLSRSQEILTYIVREVLPGLDLDEDIAKLTASMLTDEIESRRDLQHRLMQAQSS
ncbi:hypothetical protein [Sinorhizobium americanum]|uniref:Uncharacterized protein n=1 Tax=Sinorhizobium americanum TaxID=194963 RepID=A0A1L3LUN8_9HYPH|nr:hypothetical protein [Sinorhizobium americanum]APG87288.1 hypothetical protein SAMCCGM7_pC0082 [Sinorhizobium americanum CCGM7]APG93805.1 hypothetical protein SAMCFNEI73_pC0081 [Sinorhizobium americanum]OAP46271.1 hypothetical protein ATC00_04385 [Sinorhizobium americanum]